MRRRVTAAILAGMGLTVVLLVLPWVVRVRAEADKAGCLSRFERLGQFAALYNQPPKGANAADLPQAVPPGTLVNPDLPPDRRLSWIPDILPFLDQKLQPVTDLAPRFDRRGAWDAPANSEVGRTRLVLFTCPGPLPDPLADGQMPTQFVGIAGVGADAATLGLGPPIPAKAGCFRYDAPTPLRLIRDHDGLSSTALFAETADGLGPWVRGGFATVRGLDVGDGAKRPIGAGGQFGGNYPRMGGFGFADGSARFLTDRTPAAVLWAHFTLAGKGTDPIPGE